MIYVYHPSNREQSRAACKLANIFSRSGCEKLKRISNIRSFRLDILKTPMTGGGETLVKR